MKERRWFQIHLLTAIVLMFVASGVLWANLNSRRMGMGRNRDSLDVYGWPFDAAGRRATNKYVKGPSQADPFELFWYTGGIALDVGFAVVLLVEVAVACECVLRRSPISSDMISLLISGAVFLGVLYLLKPQVFV